MPPRGLRCPVTEGFIGRGAEDGRDGRLEARLRGPPVPAIPPTAGLSEGDSETGARDPETGGPRFFYRQRDSETEGERDLETHYGI